MSERPRSEDAEQPEQQYDQQDGSHGNAMGAIRRPGDAAAETEEHQNNQDDEKNVHVDIVPGVANLCNVELAIFR